MTVSSFFEGPTKKAGGMLETSFLIGKVVLGNKLVLFNSTLGVNTLGVETTCASSRTGAGVSVVLVVLLIGGPFNDAVGIERNKVSVDMEENDKVDYASFTRKKKGFFKNEKKSHDLIHPQF